MLSYLASEHCIYTNLFDLQHGGTGEPVFSLLGSRRSLLFSNERCLLSELFYGCCPLGRLFRIFLPDDDTRKRRSTQRDKMKHQLIVWLIDSLIDIAFIEMVTVAWPVFEDDRFSIPFCTQPVITMHQMLLFEEGEMRRVTLTNLFQR